MALVFILYMKEEVLQKYNNHISWLDGKDPFYRATNGFKSAINYMNNTDNSKLLPELLHNLEKLDKLRNENFFDVFPELQRLKNYA